MKFYVPQIVYALEFLHSKEIIYQDLKPENILMEANGYIRLTDFGAAKYISQAKNYTTFIGTMDYIAPEVLRKLPYKGGVDYWALGVLLFELMFGGPPFIGDNPKNTFRKIADFNLKPKFPEKYPVSNECKSFISGLLEKDPTKRLGYDNDQKILEHEWFKDIDLKKIRNKEHKPPLIPDLHGEDDTEYFLEKYTNEKPRMTAMTKETIENLKKFDPLFEGFYIDKVTELESDFSPLKTSPRGYQCTNIAEEEEND